MRKSAAAPSSATESPAAEWLRLLFLASKPDRVNKRVAALRGFDRPRQRFFASMIYAVGKQDDRLAPHALLH